MSALLQFTAFRQADVPVTDGVGAPDHFWNGLPFEADDSLAVDDGGAVVDFWQGLGFTAQNRLAVAVSGTFDHFGMGAAPFNISDQLIITSNAINDFANGVPYDAGDAVVTS